MNDEPVDWNRRHGLRDTLIALCEEGPVWDGDVPSKRDRDELITRGLACRTYLNGESGYNAATHLGVDTYLRHYEASSIKEAKSIRLARQVLTTIQKDSKKIME